MKVLMILWALGLATCDKLDRTYLPPPGSHTAGGNLVDLDLPLEFPKENYPSTRVPEISITTNTQTLGADYPNVALGIDRQGPSVSSVTSPGYFTTGPGNSLPKSVFNVPTTTPYDFVQTTTLSPVETYESTVGPTGNQGYPSYYNTDLNHPQFSSKQITNSNAPQKADRYFPNVQNVPASLLSNVDHSISSNISPQDFSNTNYPSQLGENFEDTSQVIIPTASTSYPTYYSKDQSSVNKPQKDYQYHTESIQYPAAQNSEIFDDVNVHSTDLQGKSNMGIPSKLVPTSLTPSADILSSKHSSSPASHNVDSGYDKITQPERIQAQSDRKATTLEYENILSPEGFSYSYNTSNGIHADETGTANDGVKAGGSYSYTGDDGKVYSIIYTADENGFLPRGDHLPTAPPIPDAILKVIDQAMMDKQSGIVDDGSYDAVKYGYERYEGHVPRDQIKNFIKNKPSQSILNNKIISYQNENVPARSSNILPQIHTEDYSNATADHPYITDTDNNIRNYYYPNEDHINIMSYDHLNQQNNNRANPDKTGNGILINEHLEALINKSETIPINVKIGEKPGLNRLSVTGKGPTTNDVFIPMAKDIENREDTYQSSYSGYEYRLPQKIFNYDNGHISEVGFSNYTSEKQPEVVINYDATTTKPLITPNVSFKFKSKSADDSALNLPQSIHSFALQSQSDTDSGFQSKIPPFPNSISETGSNDPNVFTDKILRNRDPENESSSLKPYNQQYPYTTSELENEREHYDYPTVFGSQYSPLITDMSSSTTSTTTYWSNYQQTTPMISQFTSTLRPSTTSEIPGFNTQRRFNNNRILSTQPDVSGNKINNGRRRLQNRPKTPVFNEGAGFTDIPKGSSRESVKAEFGLLDPSPQYQKIPSRPQDSSIDEIIGEDFSGPKQPQGFDPKHGYYY